MNRRLGVGVIQRCCQFSKMMGTFSTNSAVRQERRKSRKQARIETLAPYKQMNLDLEARATHLGLDWEYGSAVILERSPIITRENFDWENDFFDIKDRLAYYDGLDIDEPGVEQEPSPEEQEMTPDELPFEPAPRLSEADKTGDKKSLERAMHKPLYLTVRSTNSGWTFPQTTLNQGEMLGEAAERALKAQIGNLPEVFFFRRQPIGHYWSEFDQHTQQRRQIFGQKLFFYSALLVDPYQLIFEDKEVSLIDSSLNDWNWLQANEVGETLEDRRMGEYLRYLLYQADDVFPEFPVTLKTEVSA